MTEGRPSYCSRMRSPSRRSEHHASTRASLVLGGFATPAFCRRARRTAVLKASTASFRGGGVTGPPRRAAPAAGSSLVDSLRHLGRVASAPQLVDNRGRLVAIQNQQAAGRGLIEPESEQASHRLDLSLRRIFGKLDDREVVIQLIPAVARLPSFKLVGDRWRRRETVCRQPPKWLVCRAACAQKSPKRRRIEPVPRVRPILPRLALRVRLDGNPAQDWPETRRFPGLGDDDCIWRLKAERIGRDGQQISGWDGRQRPDRRPAPRPGVPTRRSRAS